MKNAYAFAFACSFVAASAEAATFTFDSSLEGFTPGLAAPVFDGALSYEPTGGNPGGFLRMADVRSGGSLLPVLAPISGDLSGFSGIRYDQRILQSLARRGIGVELRGANGDTFSYVAPLTAVDVWTTQFADFGDESQWSAAPGTSGLLADTLQDVSQVLFLMDVGPTVRVESDLDNVTLSPVPLPAGGLLLASALGMMALRRRSTK